jgi:hypothetical protein
MTTTNKYIAKYCQTNSFHPENLLHSWQNFKKLIHVVVWFGVLNFFFPHKKYKINAKILNLILHKKTFLQLILIKNVNFNKKHKRQLN